MREPLRPRSSALRRLGPWLGLLLALGCSGEEPEPVRSFPSPRLVLLYATCTLNRDYLEPYAPQVRFTPAIAGFARESVVFRRHQTEAGQSGVAFASLFTGSQAPQHGVYAHPSQLPAENLVVSEAFARAGYDVHSWLFQHMADAKLGYAQGVPAANVHKGLLTLASPGLRRILERLRADPRYRAFVLVNFTLTHGPYATEPVERFCASHRRECAVRADRAEFDRLARLYTEHHSDLSFDYANTVARLGLSDGESERLQAVVEVLYEANVSRLDRTFAGVLGLVDGLGLRDESLIAFTADHGETRFRGGEQLPWTHGFQLAPEVLQVPWILHGPGAGLSPGSYEAVTRSIDVFPTLAGLSGVALPEGAVRGVDLTPALRGLEAPPELRAFSHTALFSAFSWSFYQRFDSFVRLHPRLDPETMWVGVREGDAFHKLRRGADGGWERVAFDLGADPRETRNLYDPADPRHRELDEALRAYKASLVAGARARASAIPTDLDERQREALRQLGYAE